jgi:hypothetical protein
MNAAEPIADLHEILTKTSSGSGSLFRLIACALSLAFFALRIALVTGGLLLGFRKAKRELWSCLLFRGFPLCLQLLECRAFLLACDRLFLLTGKLGGLAFSNDFSAESRLCLQFFEGSVFGFGCHLGAFLKSRL